MNIPESWPIPWTTIKVCAFVSTLGAAATALAGVLGLTSQTAIAPVAIILAVLTGIAHFWKSQLADIAAERARITRKRFEDLEHMLAETQGLVQLYGIGLPYPLPFGGDYALTADAAAILARQLALIRPKVVVELGSGVSTILVAKLLQNQGYGRIYSLDHDFDWAAVTRDNIRATGLYEYAKVFHAPLVKQGIDGQIFLWYQIPVEVAELSQIDLLIVDGPPQKTDPTGLPRYPALPKFLSKLSQTAQIFVDDSKRMEEQEMVRLWLERYPGWQASLLQTVPGTYLMWRTGQPKETGSAV